MRDSVLESWNDFNAPLEGKTGGFSGVPWMYLDTKGYVTTGLGNLIENLSTHQPIGNLTSLGWTHGIGGPSASADTIIAAWHNVKAQQAHKHIGGGQGFWRDLNDLRLDETSILRLIGRTLNSFSQELQKDFPNFEAWPADAQLGALSMAWAMGPRFGLKFPNFKRAANQVIPDFFTMARESLIPELGTKPDGRNARNFELFTNAGQVMAQGLDPDRLYFGGLGSVSIDTAKKAGLGLLGIAAIGATAYGAYGAYKYGKTKGWVK